MTDLQAALDQIKERMNVGGYRAVALGGDPEAKVWPAETWKVCESQADVPRLLEAVETVLVKCEELEASANRKPPESEYADGVSGASAVIRRTLTEKLGADDERA